MRCQSARWLTCLLSLVALCVPLWDTSAGTNEILWQEPGVCYYSDNNPRLPLVVHVVRIDRSQPDLEFHTTLGGGKQIGVATLSEQVESLRAEIVQPVAAINGDYFYQDRPFVGDPMNLQILRGGELVSSPGVDRAFLYLDAKGQPHFTNATDAFTVTWPNGNSTSIGLNQIPANSSQPVLFTTAAGPTTRMEGVELTLERAGNGPWLPLRIGQTMPAKVREINPKGYSRLTPDLMVLSLDPKTVKDFPALAPGMELKICTATKPDLAGAILAIGGGPTLVREGKARPAQEFRGFQMRDPRSAIGWNERYFYFVEADGRQPRYSMGMTLEELASYFVKLDCDCAMNLDGGGSCTIWVGGKIVNSPSQRGRERPSANALVLVRKKKAAS